MKTIALLFLVSAVLNQCGAQPQRRANIHPVRQVAESFSSSTANKQTIMSSGGVPVLLTAMNYPDVTTMAFSTLCSLTSHDCSNKHEIKETRLIQSVLSSMRRYFYYEFVQETGCKTLLNLTFCPSHLYQLQTAFLDRTSSVLENASHDFPEKCRNICFVISERLKRREDGAIQMIQSLDSDLEDVINIMKSFKTSPAVQNMACVKLNILSKMPDLDGMTIIPALLTVMKQHKELASIQALACSTLHNLYQNGSDGGNNIMSISATSEVVELVMHAMKTFKSDEAVQKEGCFFLGYLLESGNYLSSQRKKIKKIIKAAGKYFPETCGKR